MPETYTVKLSDGREFNVTTEGGPPSEAAILASLAQSDGPKAGSAPAAENSRPGSNTALGMAAATQSAPAVAKAALNVAYNPNIAKVGGTVGKVIGAAAPTLGELATGNYGAAAATAAMSGKTAWAGGKAGYFTTRLAQQAVAPLVNPLEKAAPVAKAIGAHLSIAQGALDLAQMADPDRHDIGVLGVGPSVKTGAIPDTPKLVSMAVEDAVKSLTDAGWPEARAKSYVTQMRKLMSR